MQSKDTALHRIKKQLALAGNAAASEQEKKTALKMAQMLMRQYNLTDTELTASKAGETETPANVKKIPRRMGVQPCACLRPGFQLPIPF